MRTAVISISIVLGLAVVLTSCTDQANPVEVTTHPDGWSAREVHGLQVVESPVGAQNCETCHGEDLKGGTSGVSCSQAACHTLYPHPDDFVNVESVNFHGTFAAERAGWDITVCKDCHGANYDGEGFEALSCRRCHTQPQGPEACNTCHGSDDNNAPPRDLQGRTSTTYATVGAHQAHVATGVLEENASDTCVHCHEAVGSFAAAGHIDGSMAQAEVSFGARATGDGQTTPVWDPASGTCSGVYCHGTFAFARDGSGYEWAFDDATISGDSASVSWTSVGTGEAACGTCHGLPPDGHRMPDPRVPVADCSTCHPRVVDSNMQIIDKRLHANGQIDVF